MDKTKVSPHGEMFALNNIMKPVYSILQLVIHQQIVVLVNSFCLLCSSCKTLVDHFRSLSASSNKTLFQFLHGGRCYKYQHSFREFLLDLAGSLNLDLQDHIPAC